MTTAAAVSDNPRDQLDPAAPLTAYDRAFIGGAWVPVDGARQSMVDDSFTEQPIASVHLADAAMVDAAVRAARKALPAWSAAPAGERAALLRRIGEGLMARADELALTVSREVGMPLRLSQRVQILGPASAWAGYADLAEGLEEEEVRIGHSLITREPVGVVACITPWNYPLNQITAKVAAALAAGCTVVLKPSELAPSSAQALAEVIAAAGAPAGVFNLVFGDGSTTGEALVAHAGVDMVSFTGSTAVGRRIAEVAGRSVKRVALELGGKSASIVLDDADLASAVRHAVSSCCLNSGQTCSAITRLIVPRASLPQVRELVAANAQAMRMGDPLDKATRLGPLISAGQRKRVETYVEQALARGGELLFGPDQTPAQGHFVAPTVIAVSPGDPLDQEEVFGPVLSVLVYDDLDQAVEIANGTPYGLAGAVWSADADRAVKVARRIHAGQVDVNGAPYNPDAPFGGFKQSGIGREHGQAGLDEFLETRSIQLPG